MKRAAATAGVAHGTASAILYGKHADDPSHPDYRVPRRRVRRDIAEALLAVTYEPAGWTIVDFWAGMCKAAARINGRIRHALDGGDGTRVRSEDEVVDVFPGSGEVSRTTNGMLL